MTITTKVVGIVERDIDLVLFEEFVSNLDFVKWFIKSAADDKPLVTKVISVINSVTQDKESGESDLELFVNLDDGQRLGLLIENKINAQWQKDQAERYHARAKEYKTQATLDRAITVVVAPDKYLTGNESAEVFDARITYEAICEWLAASDNSARTKHKTDILRAALDKSSLSYQMAVDESVTTFYHSLEKLCAAKFAALEMKPPGEKPRDSRIAYFSPDELPKGIKIACQFKKHRSVLMFSRQGNKAFCRFKERMGSVIESGMEIVQMKGSAGIAIKGQCVDVTLPFEHQCEAIQERLQDCQRLLEWYRKHDQLVA